MVRCMYVSVVFYCRLLLEHFCLVLRSWSSILMDNGRAVSTTTEQEMTVWVTFRPTWWKSSKGQVCHCITTWALLGMSCDTYAHYIKVNLKLIYLALKYMSVRVCVRAVRLFELCWFSCIHFCIHECYVIIFKYVCVCVRDGDCVYFIHFKLSRSKPILDFLGPCVDWEGGGMGVMNETHLFVFHSVSNRARGKRSRNSVSSAARYAFNSIVLVSSKRLYNIHIAWFNWFFT